jgi:tetratricopeptide (TPR) repeat protein
MSASLIHPGPEGRVKGVFSTTVKATIGFGHTKRKKPQQFFVYAEELEGGRVSIQPLNKNYVPSGEVRYLSRDELLNNYIPEPEVYMAKVYPAIQQVARSLASGEMHYKKGQLFSAEYEFKNALRIDEENIRATFGLGLTYLERGEKEKGDLVFRRIVKLGGAFESRHKHLFNEFGIKLRKNKMLTQAMNYYARAFQFTKDDEHLYYNMGRTLYDKGSYPTALRFAEKAVALNPDFELGKQLVAILQRKVGKSRKNNDKGKTLYAVEESYYKVDI